MADTKLKREEFNEEQNALLEIHELLSTFDEGDLEGIKMFLMGVAFGASPKKH